MLQDIPEMYRNCNTTEDKDMNVFDFVTDHLINIDSLFDKHNNGDQQKPHSPVQSHHVIQTIAFHQLITYFTFKVKKVYFEEKKVFQLQFDSFLSSNYSCKVFRPPILA